MSLITRTFFFTDGTTAYGSQVDSEISNIVNTINNLDTAAIKWDQISILNSSSVPLTVDNSTGSQDIADFKANGSIKVSINSTGVLGMGGSKITNLANGSASSDAAAFGQIPTISNNTFTPSVVGAGTLAQKNGFYQQIGNMVHVWGTFECGTVASSSTLNMAIPTGSITYTNRAPTDGSLHIGTFYIQDNSALGSGNKFGVIFLDGVDTANVYFTTKGSAAGTVAWPKPVPNTMLNNSDAVSFDFWYAIA